MNQNSYLSIHENSFNKANLRDLIGATGLAILPKLNSNRSFVSPCDLDISWMTPKTIGHLFHATLSFLHHFIALGEFNWSDSQETPYLGQNRRFFKPCDLEIWRMNFKSNRAPLLCYFKLCVSFRRHWWIQTGVTVRKRPIWVKFDDFFTRMTFKFDSGPWKTIRHLFYATSSFVSLVCLLPFEVQETVMHTSASTKMNHMGQ